MPDIFIDVHDNHTYVSRRRENTNEPCANWRQLENLAAQVVSKLSNPSAACPDWLAVLALWREDIFQMVMTPAQIGREMGLGKTTALKAVQQGRIPAHHADERTWLVLREDAEQKWGKHEQI